MMLTVCYLGLQQSKPKLKEGVMTNKKSEKMAGINTARNSKREHINITVRAYLITLRK